MPIAKSLRELQGQCMSTTPMCAIALRSGDRERHYVITCDLTGHTTGDVWIGHGHHRTRTATDVRDARSLVAEFAREIADLLEDGWNETFEGLRYDFD